MKNNALKITRQIKYISKVFTWTMKNVNNRKKPKQYKVVYIYLFIYGKIRIILKLLNKVIVDDLKRRKENQTI